MWAEEGFPGEHSNRGSVQLTTYLRWWGRNSEKHTIFHKCCAFFPHERLLFYGNPRQARKLHHISCLEVKSLIGPRGSGVQLQFPACCVSQHNWTSGLGFVFRNVSDHSSVEINLTSPMNRIQLKCDYGLFSLCPSLVPIESLKESDPVATPSNTCIRCLRRSSFVCTQKPQ